MTLNGTLIMITRIGSRIAGTYFCGIHRHIGRDHEGHEHGDRHERYFIGRKIPQTEIMPLRVFGGHRDVDNLSALRRCSQAHPRHQNMLARLQLHLNMIRRYIRQKKHKQTKIGGTTIRIRRSELDRFIVEGGLTDDDEKSPAQEG